MKAMAYTTIVFCSFLSRPVLSQEGSYSIFSFSETSCGAWKNSKDQEWARAQYYHWFRGFVSGFNYANRSEQVELGTMPDKATLFMFIDKYCSDNPLKGFVPAAFELVKALKVKVPPMPQTKEEKE